MAEPHRALVIGASGMVGWALYRGLKQEGIPVVGTTLTTDVAGLICCDLRDSKKLSDLINESRPKWIFIPGGWTHVDGCELDPNRSWQINVAPIATILRAGEQAASQIVYFSSDYVFNGKDGPYNESDRADPLSVYGLHKLAVEKYLGLHAPGALIIRTTWVFGPDHRGKSFVHTLIRHAESGAPITVANDQWGNPTFSPELASVVIKLARGHNSGIWNVAGEDRMSREQWARMILRTWVGTDYSIMGVSTRTLALNACRPLQAGLKLDKIKGHGVMVESTERALESFLINLRRGQM